MKSVNASESAGNGAPQHGTTGRSTVCSGTTRFVHAVVLERSTGAPHKPRVNEAKTRQKRSGSSGSSGSICGSGTTQLRVWFQFGVVIPNWYHSTYSQKRSGTTRRKRCKSSPRLAGSGCGTMTVFNGNSGELALCSSTQIYPVVPVNLRTALLEPHGKHHMKGCMNNAHEPSHTNTHEHSRTASGASVTSVAGSCCAHDRTADSPAINPYTDNLRNERRIRHGYQTKTS